MNPIYVNRKVGSDRSDRSVPHQRVNCVVILRFMYHTCCTNNLDGQKAKADIKVRGSRKRRVIAEAGLKASEEKQRQGINQELSRQRLAALKKSIRLSSNQQLGYPTALGIGGYDYHLGDERKKLWRVIQ